MATRLHVLGSAPEPPAGAPAWAALWTLAFAAFTVCYAPILVRPRADGRPG